MNWTEWANGSIFHTRAAWRAAVTVAIEEGLRDGLKRRVYRHPFLGWTWDLV